MDQWIQDLVKNSKFSEVNIINEAGYPIIVPMASYFKTGIIYLQPILQLGGLPNAIEQCQKSSLVYLNENSYPNHFLILQGTLEVLTSEESNFFPANENKIAFDKKEDEDNPRIIRFVPNKIIAWNDFNSFPTEIDLEMVI